MDDKDLYKVMDEFTPTYLHLWFSGGKYCVSTSRAVLLVTVPHKREVSPASLLTMGRDFVRQHCK